MNDKKTAVVIAASDGIGRASAEKLAEQGARVVLFARSQAKLDQVTAQIASRGGEAVAIAGDLTREADLMRLFDKVDQWFGGTEILVNNGPGPCGGDLLSLADEDWERALQEQVMPTFRAIRRVLPRMIERGWGRIITIASTSVKMPIEGLDLSNFTRTGLAAVHRTLARAMAKHEINVHMVLPGMILTERSRTRIVERAKAQGISFDEALAASAARIPKGRLGKPSEVGDLVAFLASERASYLVGDFISVDGGLNSGLT